MLPNVFLLFCRSITQLDIAETSITIEDVVFVVDTGRVKENRRDEVNETPTLEECYVSRASAKQRRGRAGRVRPGIAYHLYSRYVFIIFKYIDFFYAFMKFAPSPLSP